MFAGNLLPANIQDDLSYLIKIPKTESENNTEKNFNIQLLLIKEAFINLYIINDFILNKSINFIFTFGLLFSQNCYDKGECTPQYNINLIQQNLNKAKTFRKIIEENIDLLTFVNYLKQIFNQLVKLEESQFQLIHGDLHCDNILISDDKAFIIDWGDSSFIYYEYRFRSIKNLEESYFKGERDINIKTGLYDLYLLLKDCLTIKNENINYFINALLKEIFFGKIQIYNNTSKQIELFNGTQLEHVYYLYHIIGGYDGNDSPPYNFKIEIYKFNKPHFIKYTYREILKEITKLYDEKDQPKINRKCRKN